MQICIHRKDNSPKAVNHRLTLKEGPKVKSENIRRFPAHDFLQVGFILQASRTNNKQVISTFKFGYRRLTLKEGPKVKSDHIKRFPAHDYLLPAAEGRGRDIIKRLPYVRACICPFVTFLHEP